MFLLGHRFHPSSPGYACSNGQIERSIQTIKSSLIKVAQNKNDDHFALMEYKSTPMDGLFSPAEILMGHRFCTLIPTLPSQLVPHYDCSAIQERLHFRQQQQHKNVLHSHPLEPLQENIEVLFCLHNKWCKGKIFRVGNQPRSFAITAEDSRDYRSNRIHIKVLKPDSSVESKIL